MDMNGDSNVDSRPFLFGGLSPNFLSAVSTKQCFMCTFKRYGTWHWHQKISTPRSTKYVENGMPKKIRRTTRVGLVFHRFFFGHCRVPKMNNSPGPVAPGSRIVFSFKVINSTSHPSQYLWCAGQIPNPIGVGEPSQGCFINVSMKSCIINIYTVYRFKYIIYIYIYQS